MGIEGIKCRVGPMVHVRLCAWLGQLDGHLGEVK